MSKVHQSWNYTYIYIYVKPLKSVRYLKIKKYKDKKIVMNPIIGWGTTRNIKYSVFLKYLI